MLDFRLATRPKKNTDHVKTAINVIQIIKVKITFSRPPEMIFFLGVRASSGQPKSAELLVLTSTKTR